MIAQPADQSRIHVFIDANVLLAFFDYSEDDLHGVRALIAEVRRGRVVIHATQQLQDEVTRNRATKINTALELLGKQSLDIKLPTVCKGYPEFNELKKLQRDYNSKRAELLRVARQDVDSKSLSADRVLQEFFTAVTIHEVSEELVFKARRRADLGNPPERSGSIGDAVHWEHLIDSVPSKTDLHLISCDKDFATGRGSGTINEFLQAEWMMAKQANVLLFRSINEFLETKMPLLRLPSHSELSDLINELDRSSNFARTHQVIASLQNYDISDIRQVEDILRTCLQNTQVRWIITDNDVSSFLVALLGRFEASLDVELVSEVKSALGIPRNDRGRVRGRLREVDPYDPFADDSELVDASAFS